jgi:hypothetical protein
LLVDQVKRRDQRAQTEGGTDQHRDRGERRGSLKFRSMGKGRAEMCHTRSPEGLLSECNIERGRLVPSARQELPIDPTEHRLCRGRYTSVTSRNS